jgi:recombination protein RecA
MTVDPSQLDKALANIRKEYGPEIMRTADSYHEPNRISTGSLELDLITRGGIPIGRWSHFYGGQFSAKSMIAFKAIASAQKMGLKCAYYNVEKQLSPEWAAQHGIELEKLEVVETTVIEEIGAIMETLMGSVHFHVIDSIPAAISQDELAGETGDWLPGIMARAWGKTVRRAHQSFTEDNAVLMINHVGTVFGKYAGSDEPKGGKSLEYLSSLSIEFRRTSWLYRDKKGSLNQEGESESALDKRDKEPGGIEFAARVKKSRVSTPFKTARMRLDFKDGDIDDLWSLAKAAQIYELAQRESPKSSWYTMPDGKKVQGENGIRAYIAENPDFYQTVIDEIVKEA